MIFWVYVNLPEGIVLGPGFNGIMIMITVDIIGISCGYRGGIMTMGSIDL